MTDDPFDFTGKVALVTGSSRGIGAGIVHALAARGARCVVNYVWDPDHHNQSDAEAVAFPFIRQILCIECDASNAGVIALTKVTARELARQNITVNAIAPGFIKTEMTRDLPNEVVRQTLAKLPIGHFGEIEDVANAALFLCSADAQYITGQVL